ncbi:helix-turn-helix domain-containing protein [Metapseudomonas otitidis]
MGKVTAAPSHVVHICTKPTLARVIDGTQPDQGRERYRRLMSRSHGDQPPITYLAAGAWPDGKLTADAPPSAAAAQHLARTLRVVMAETRTGQRALASATGVAHTTIGRILAGAVLCDIGTLAKLEHALGRPLWRPPADNEDDVRFGDT